MNRLSDAYITVSPDECLNQTLLSGIPFEPLCFELKGIILFFLQGGGVGVVAFCVGPAAWEKEKAVVNKVGGRGPLKGQKAAKKRSEILFSSALFLRSETAKTDCGVVTIKEYIYCWTEGGEIDVWYNTDFKEKVKSSKTLVWHETLIHCLVNRKFLHLQSAQNDLLHTNRLRLTEADLKWPSHPGVQDHKCTACCSSQLLYRWCKVSRFIPNSSQLCVCYNIFMRFAD